MSVEIQVFLRRSRMPAPADWASAIRQRFELEMDADFDVDEFTGFLPCRYQGEEAGFEYYAEPISVEALLQDGVVDDEEAAALGDIDFLVTFVTHSDLREYAASLIAAALLAELAGGHLADNGEPPFIRGADAVDWARTCLREVEAELA